MQKQTKEVDLLRERARVRTQFFIHDVYTSWIVLACALVCFTLYEQACWQIEKDQLFLQQQVRDLEVRIQQEMQRHEVLTRELGSQNDPEWIEQILIKTLGVVPPGYKKIFISNSE